MRTSVRVFMPFLLLLLLCGCGKEQANQPTVLVCVEEAVGCTVENNGQQVAPGADAVFTLNLDPGYSLTGADYSGKFDVDTGPRTATLVLHAVRYPTRVRLTLSSRYITVTYDANGGLPLPGKEYREIRTYDLTYHLRPNTALGTDLFVREGYTLAGWNTEPDGSGTAIGLGSRVTAPTGRITLYAQWAQWSDSADFAFTRDGDDVTITGYRGTDRVLVIPSRLDGCTVTTVTEGAFTELAATQVLFPPTMRTVAPGAFQNCALQSVTLYDNIRSISDDSFRNCPEFRTLHINAIEPPFGYTYRKESCYADKVDRMILTQGQRRVIFYGGCSVWYNLDGSLAQRALGDGYAVVNLGLNGTVNSPVQMQILGAFLHEGDILIHTPELSSRQQLLIHTDMSDHDERLWCGIENNYDLFSLVDLTTFSGVLDSLCHYLSLKNTQTSYSQFYQDDYGMPYIDSYGCIPFYRSDTEKILSDTVYLDPEFIVPEAMDRLEAYYSWFRTRGAQVYVAHACVNLDAVPREQQENVALMDRLFGEAIGQMENATLISRLEDHVYHHSDFYDTNYHLRSEPARQNTALWLRELQEQLEREGLWHGTGVSG